MQINRRYRRAPALGNSILLSAVNRLEGPRKHSYVVDGLVPVDIVRKMLSERPAPGGGASSSSEAVRIIAADVDAPAQLLVSLAPGSSS